MGRARKDGGTFDSATLKCAQKTFQRGNAAEANQRPRVVRQNNTFIYHQAGLMNLLRLLEKQPGCFQV